jgi:hypothetical protein
MIHRAHWTKAIPVLLSIMPFETVLAAEGSVKCSSGKTVTASSSGTCSVTATSVHCENKQGATEASGSCDGGGKCVTFGGGSCSVTKVVGATGDNPPFPARPSSGAVAPSGGILDNGPTLTPQAPSRTGTPSSR